MNAPAVCLDITDVTKTYNRGKVKALNGVSLQVMQGEVFGLIGPNGAGKTTLMQCLLGLLRPTSGTVRINGYTPQNLAVKQISAFLPERPLFDAWMTPRQFLSYHHMLAKQPDKTRKEDVEEFLNIVGLDPAARGRKIKGFSRGMLQRLGLAQMLVGKPTLCFLDEPASGMDPIGANLVREMLLAWKQKGATVILNSHHLEEVERVCDRVAFIEAGQIQSIQILKENENKAIRMIVRFQSNQAGTYTDAFAQVAEAVEGQLENCGVGTAKILLPNKDKKAALIAALVQFNIPVEEIFADRRALEELFISHERERRSQREKK